MGDGDTAAAEGVLAPQPICAIRRRRDAEEEIKRENI